MPFIKLLCNISTLNFLTYKWFCVGGSHISHIIDNFYLSDLHEVVKLVSI